MERTIVENGNVYSSFAVIYEGTKIGLDNWVGPFAVIGSPAEHRGQELTGPGAEISRKQFGVVIGDRNTIREHVTVQSGIESATQIGNDCYIMSKAHIPHDALLRSHVTVSSSATIGGHSIIGEKSNIGLNATIHQRSVIGFGAMVGMSSIVKKAVPPFALGYGSPYRLTSANDHVLAQLGWNSAICEQINLSYKTRIKEILFELDELREIIADYETDCDKNSLDAWSLFH
jgi:UDP-N-acetylglucosamine acyltransferase